MKKGTLVFNLIIVALIMFGIPAALLYYNDTKRVTQLNNLQKKIMWSEKEKDIKIVRDQMTEKLNSMFNIAKPLSEDYVSARYKSITSDRIIRNSSYSKKSSKDAISKQFIKNSKKFNEELAILFRNGNILEANKSSVAKKNFKGDTKFLQTIASKKIISNIDFASGAAEYFIPVMDTKDRLVSVIYVKNDITDMAEKLRNETQSKRGYNFIVDTTGTVLLSTDKTKENSENIQENRDIKGIITGLVEDENIKEAEYSNAKGLFGYRKNKDLGLIFCLFTPYTDYKSLNTESKNKFDLFIFDTQFVVPVYVILAAVLAIGFIMIASIAGGPYKPLKKITRALVHIDEDSFETLLPKIKSGEYKKIINSLIILKGRVKASEGKAEKLSLMSKELEEELSKEASRADMELSELRDAVKIAENNKANAEEQIAKAKQEAEKAKEAAIAKAEEEKAALNAKLMDAEKEKRNLKEEITKAQQSKIPVEKENMRMESVLMMNTELKGVLSVIKTYISSVLGGEGKITDAQQQFLGVVINKSARLERLINDLTELARLEKGETKLAKSPVDINTVIQDIVFAIQPQADVKKVDLKVNFAPTIPTGLGDASKISNIITQLLTQAIKVSPRGGQVIAETKEDSKNAFIRISDFGMSMPKAKSEALFMNFHGPESVSGPEYVNTGLRFPIIKAVIHSMGGEIHIESEIGKGKTFVISLPKDTRTAGIQEDFNPAKNNARETIIKPVEAVKSPEPKPAEFAALPDLPEPAPKPAEPVKPIVPPKPAEPAALPDLPEPAPKPAEPVKPIVPPKPVEPVKPIIPPKPADGPKLVDPLAAATGLSSSEKPAEPAKFSDGPKLVDPLKAATGDSPVPNTSAPIPPAGGSFKIQTNAMAGQITGNTVPGAKPDMKNEVPTVPDILAKDSGTPGKTPEMPGKDTKVPDNLMGGNSTAPPKAQLPDDLPPLPDLEDDKGTDII